MAKSNLIDKIIGYFSPERAYERAAWRNELDSIENGYDAGSRGRLNYNWNVYNDSAEHIDARSRDLIKARARDLERNSDIANSVISAYKRNVVGKGFQLQAKTDNEELNAQLESLWKIWTKKYNCDITCSQSLNQIVRMAVVRKKVDGGILFKKCYTKDGIIPFKLQAIEVDELDTTATTPKHKGNVVTGGIEFDRYNKAVGYYIKQYRLDGFSELKNVYVPAKDMIFLFSKKRPSQVREISDMAQSLTRVRDANEFINAVSVKERIAACLSVFVKRSLPVSGLGGIGRGGDSGESRRSYGGKMLSPGMVTEMNPGDDIQVVDPKNGASDASDFLKTQQRLIGAGQGLSYEATSRDMSQTNYSSARQGSIEDELTFTEEIELIKENLLDEIYETFLISCFLSGRINAPDFFENKESYTAHEWISSPKKWIDPMKESNANATALKTNQKTFKQIAAENGRDWKEMIDDMAEVMKYAASVGLPMIGGVEIGKTGEE